VSTVRGNSGRWDGPWNCPFCDYKSPRKWNMRVHIDRRHGKTDNPYYHFPPKAENPNLHKRVSSKDSIGFSVNSPSLTPQPIQDNSMVRSLWIQYLLKQIEELSNLEFSFLWPVIMKRLFRPPYWCFIFQQTVKLSI